MVLTCQPHVLQTAGPGSGIPTQTPVSKLPKPHKHGHKRTPSGKVVIPIGPRFNLFDPLQPSHASKHCSTENWQDLVKLSFFLSFFLSLFHRKLAQIHCEVVSYPFIPPQHPRHNVGSVDSPLRASPHCQCEDDEAPQTTPYRSSIGISSIQCAGRQPHRFWHELE